MPRTALLSIVFAAVAACSGGDDDSNAGAGGQGGCAVYEDAKVGPILCGCGKFGGPDTEAADECSPQLLGHPAVCIDHPSIGLCDCRAYICQTRASDGVCTCGVASVGGSAGDDYSDSCETTSGVCCLEGVECRCGVSQCGSSATSVDSCDADKVLDQIGSAYLSGDAKLVSACSN